MFDFYNKERFEKLEEQIESLSLTVLQLQTAKEPKIPENLGSRVAELEIKIAKLWTVLVKIDSRGTERPTNTARKIFGNKLN